MIKKTLYFGNPAYLSLRNGQMVLRLPQVEKNDTLSASFKKKAERTFPIEDLGIVILDDKRITVTQGLLDCLAENNCAVIICDSTHHPAGLLLPMEGNTLLGERSRFQVECSRCVLSCKDTNLKAIHNGAPFHRLRPSDVYYPAKIQI